MRTARSTVAIVGLLAVTVSACGGVAQSGDRTANQKLVDGTTFTMAIGSDPGTLDPHLTVLSVAGQVGRFLYDSMIGLAKDGKPIAGLAEKWDATTTAATFTLRKGITCSDGSPLTASDVAANINFVGDPANKSPISGLAIASGTKATADDAARTVSLTSGKPDAFLLRNAGSLAILCGNALRDRALPAKGSGGTGMFTMTEAVPNDHYTLTRRKDYAWGPGEWKSDQPGLPEKVVLRVVPNATTVSNLLLSGGLNAAAVIGPDRQRLTAQKLFHADFLAPVGEFFFNQGAGRPGRDEAVRRALVQALDLGQVGKVLTNGTGEPAKGLVTAEPKACDGDTITGNVPAHDLASAKSTLDAAGWTPGPDGVRAKDGKRLALTVIYGTQSGPTVAPTAELVQQSWKAVGAEVTLKGVDSPGLSQVLFGTGEWEVSMAPLGLVLPSQAVPFFSGAQPPNGTNFAHIENAEYDGKVRQAAMMAGDASCPTWLAAEAALVKRVDTVSYVDSVVPYFGSGTKFEVNAGSVDPSSIRMYG
ncbi:ABC transporter substrate-binding protein [Solihabitans fulvus]|uniref:ABC transporter substrate-binding protein n=1 Tax=Solihabitans fulvus TaxID=1892852 RepID=A0A5B2XDL3_9PSEU|nr:ABC transporter substrate-binding protein [Solihabitans fulvus]KAA2261443.1 ABC transporter substrate-binding protein [Solihabitans fulvus]